MASFDVAIIGGGPAGSTCASLLRKYDPRLRVAVFERERFPRDHVGESQLPYIGSILDEMGCWEKVERAGFPIKVGATYRWGKTDDLWDFEFVPNGELSNEPRPGRYEGQRRLTAFQVDRAIYDKILLDHARELGAVVREQHSVRQVLSAGDRIEALIVQNPEGGDERVTARWYVDASGHTGVLRRAMGVETQSPTTLQNIAIWDYWQNAEWAVSIGVGGTRVQVMSLGYGWIWFIPLGPTRTSVGLIVPASYYKTSGKRPTELYAEALASDPVIAPLLANATQENKLSTTKDWSFLADRTAGENWFLAGESAGFADPILAAGMTLAHSGARDVAYSILALERRDYEADWIREHYDTTQRRHILSHIRFADFWYTANGCFTDLKDHAQSIASSAGLDLTPDLAWQWLGTGGFVKDDLTLTGVGGYNLTSVKGITENFLGVEPTWKIGGASRLTLNLEGAEKGWSATKESGRISRYRCYLRDGKVLPTQGVAGLIFQSLKRSDRLEDLFEAIDQYADQKGLSDPQLEKLMVQIADLLEAMVTDGWVIASSKEGEMAFPLVATDHSSWMHPNRDRRARVGTLASATERA